MNISFPLGYMPKSAVAGLSDSCMFSFTELPSFSRVLYHCTVPLAKCERYSFSAFLPPH